MADPNACQLPMTVEAKTVPPMAVRHLLVWTLEIAMNFKFAIKVNASMKPKAALASLVTNVPSDSFVI